MALKDCNESQVQEMLTLFKTLSNDTRLKIARMICRKSRYAHEIEEQFDCDRTNITKHLNILKHSGIITVQKEGRKSLFSFNKEFVKNALSCLDPEKYGLEATETE